MLEEYRGQLKNKLKGDYLTYMTERTKQADLQYHRRNSIAGEVPAHARPNAWLQEFAPRANENLLAHSSNRLTKVASGFVKELYDSCYLRPDQNKSVI